MDITVPLDLSVVDKNSHGDFWNGWSCPHRMIEHASHLECEWLRPVGYCVFGKEGRQVYGLAEVKRCHNFR